MKKLKFAKIFFIVFTSLTLLTSCDAEKELISKSNRNIKKGNTEISFNDFKRETKLDDFKTNIKLTPQNYLARTAEGAYEMNDFDVDTDVIIPARYLNIADFEELAEHAMEDIDLNFAPNVQKGDIIVAGRNFGCGSSREHAPMVLKVRGVQCIIADSFARIFYRNAINIGLPALEIGKEVEKIEAGDELEVNLTKGEIKIVNKGLVINTKPLPEFVQKIADCGGLINYIKGEK